MAERKAAPQTPEEALAAIASVDPKEVQLDVSSAGPRASLPTLSDKFTYAAPAVVINVRGFETKIASDIFSLTGNKDAAKRADTLAKLLGDTLYQQVRTAAKCAGLDDEASYLSQELALALEADEFDLAGAEEDEDGATGFNKDFDGQVSSPVNVAIAEAVQPSNLGRIVQLAKSFDNPHAKGVTVLAAFRYGTLNLFARKVAIGL